MATLNKNSSIVDYLKSSGQDSSMQARSKLAQQQGINNYKGTADQNIQLLSSIRNSGGGGKKKSQPSSPSTNQPQAQATGGRPQRWEAPDVQAREVDYDQYRTEGATINDVANKYGFDFSREYAERIAEQEAQRRKREVEGSRERVEQETESAKTDLEHDFFNQFIQQQQDIVNSGLNAGIEAGRQTQLDMSRQNALSDILAQAQLQNQDLDRTMQTIAEEQGLRTENLYDQRMQLASQLMGQMDSFNQRENQQALQTAMQNASRDYQAQMDNARLGMQENQMDWSRFMDDRNFGFQQDKFGWQQQIDEAGLTGMWDGSKTWDRQMDESRLALQRQQMAQRQAQAQRQAEMERLAQIAEQEQARRRASQDAQYAQIPNFYDADDRNTVMTNEMRELDLIDQARASKRARQMEALNPTYTLFQ